MVGPDALATWQNEACATWFDGAGSSRSVRSRLKSE